MRNAEQLHTNIECISRVRYPSYDPDLNNIEDFQELGLDLEQEPDYWEASVALSESFPEVEPDFIDYDAETYPWRGARMYRYAREVS